LLTQEIRDGVCFVQLHLDPERKSEPFSNLPRVKILHGLPGAAPAKATAALQWKNADLLEAAIPIAGRETVLNTVEISGQQPVTLPPVCLPYSPEFAPDQPGRGAAALAQIATTTGGKAREEIPKIWGDLPVKSRYVELAPWLLVFATILFLLEVLERRTGWVTRFAGRKTYLGSTPAPDVEGRASGSAASASLAADVRKVAVRSVFSAKARKTAAGAGALPAAEPKPAPEKPARAESAIDTLRKARERANRRTDKER
jgi:hypothetical protein